PIWATRSTSTRRDWERTADSRAKSASSESRARSASSDIMLSPVAAEGRVRRAIVARFSVARGPTRTTIANSVWTELHQSSLCTRLASASLRPNDHGGTMAEKTQDEAVRKLLDLVKEIKVAMMTTRRADGRLVSRPMAKQEEEAPGADFWFVTARDSDKVSE